MIAATSLLFFKQDVTQYDTEGVGTGVLISVSHHLLRSSGQKASPSSAPRPLSIQALFCSCGRVFKGMDMMRQAVKHAEPWLRTQEDTVSAEEPGEE